MSTNLPERVSRDGGYRSDSIDISRDMGPLRVEGCASLGHTPCGGVVPVIFETITFLIQKHFKTVTVTVNSEKINSNYFQDGNWESKEMKG